MTTALATGLRPDPAVPQRDVLVDGDLVAPRLSVLLGLDGPLDIESCRQMSVTYSVGRRVRVLYRVGIEGREHHVSASSFRSSSRSTRAYRRALEDAQTCGALRSVALDDELNTVFWVWPNDRRVEGFRALAGPAPSLSRLLGGRWTKSSFVDYYPEASAVVQCLGAEDRLLAYGKVLAKESAKRAASVHRSVARASAGTVLHVPRLLAYSPPHGALLIEPVAGDSIGGLSTTALREGLHAYGTALATLHSLSVEGVPAPDRTPLERLTRRARGLDIVRPDIAEETANLVAAAGGFAEFVDDPVTIHGDANANNAILREGRVSLIDFDRASRASAATDIANFLSLLRYQSVFGEFDSDEESSRAGAFLDGYTAVRDLPDDASLRLHTAVAVAERAVATVYRIRALDLLPQLLGEARGILQREAA